MLGSGKCTVIMRCKIVLVSVLLQVTFSFDISNDENHPALVHLAQIERPGYWTFVEDNSQPIPFSRLGRKLFKLPNTLIPYPRTGRMLLDSDIFDYEESLVPADYSWHNIGDGDFFFDGKSSVKRASIAFPPRVGRKKRSISDEDQLEHEDQERTHDKDFFPRSTNQDWFGVDDFAPEFFFRPDRRPSSKSRNSFVPRVGKKRSEHGMEDAAENKRASAAYQPRIGRANNPRGIFQVKSRGSFIPRAGRRAAFIPRLGKRAKLNPRVGRSERHSTENQE